MQPQEVTDLDIAFGVAGGCARLMPDKKTLTSFMPQRWSLDLFQTLFYRGGSMAHLEPKAGIEHRKALRHIKAVLGSYEPKARRQGGSCRLLFRELVHPQGWAQS